VVSVVVTVRVAVPAAVPMMLTGFVEPKLKVGSCALTGEEVNVGVSVTLPVNPPDGVTVTVNVFPVVAPRVTVTDAATPIVKPGGPPVMVTEPYPMVSA
jgi:hypothetical protein